MKYLKIVWALPLLMATAATAASSPTAKGLTIAPPLQQIIITEAPTTPLSIGVSNTSDAAQTLNLSVVDFESLNEIGGVGFASNGSQYGLARFLKLDAPTLTLQPHASDTIRGTIVNDYQLTPGGHYGAVQIALAADKTGSGPNVSLRQIASSLIFATKTGGLKFELTLDSIKGFKQVAFTPPKLFTMRFHNTGNVHVTPRGIALVKDPLGRTVSKGIVNDSSSIILPGAYRQLPVIMQRQAATLWPGRYEVTVQYRYDGTPSAKTSVYHVFVYGPLIAILGIVLVAGGAILAILRLYRPRHHRAKKKFRKIFYK